MKSLNIKNIAILILLALVIALVLYVIFNPHREQSPDVSKKVDEYWRKSERTDSTLNVLQSNIEKLQNERKRLQARINKTDSLNHRNEVALQYLNYTIDNIKKQLNENRPNFVDSSFQSIDDALPD